MVAAGFGSSVAAVFRVPTGRSGVGLGLFQAGLFQVGNNDLEKLIRVEVLLCRGSHLCKRHRANNVRVAIRVVEAQPIELKGREHPGDIRVGDEPERKAVHEIGFCRFDFFFGCSFLPEAPNDGQGFGNGLPGAFILGL